MFPFFLIPTNTGERLCDNNGGTLFRCVPYMERTFLCAEEEHMDDKPRRVVDITGVELTPGEPAVCLGNGEQGFECCCDECDHFLLCFPEFDPKNKKSKK